MTTVTEDGTPAGFTANSFTSVSLDPPLILVCIGKSSSNFAAFERATHFGVNILAESQRAISGQFSAKGVDRFAGVDWMTGSLGSPIISDSVTWLECALHERIDAGDHHILIGRVDAFGQNSGSPLAYCRGNYVMFELEQQVASSKHHRARFGAILDTPGGIVLVPGAEPGSLTLPSAPRLGAKDVGGGLYDVLAKLNVPFDLEFLFSVWQEDDGDELHVVYRGTTLSSPSTEGAVVVPCDAIPYERLQADERVLLTRYAEERASFRFSVYSGTKTRGDWWQAPAGRVAG